MSQARQEKGVDATGSPSHAGGPAIEGVSSLSLDKDVAIGLVGEHAREIDPEIEKTVLKKIDWFLIPAMVVGQCSFYVSISLSCSQLIR